MSESFLDPDQLQRDRRERLTEWGAAIDFASRLQIAENTASGVRTPRDIWTSRVRSYRARRKRLLADGAMARSDVMNRTVRRLILSGVALMTPLIAAFTEPPNIVVALCERALMDHLHVPSSYHRLSADQKSAPLGRADMEAWLRRDNPANSIPELMKLYDEGQLRPHRHRVQLTFQTLNNENVRTTHSVTCEHISLSAQPVETPFRRHTLINGIDSIQWFATRVRSF